MFDFLGLEDGADPIRSVGAKVGGLGDALEAKNAAALAAIEAIEAGAPWGADEAGMAFYKQYTEGSSGESDPAAGGGEAPTNASMKGMLTSGADELHRLSDGIVKTMDFVELTDANNAADINSIKKP
jgi:hypothetical protein